jgi:hypothetical protein
MCHYTSFFKTDDRTERKNPGVDFQDCIIEVRITDVDAKSQRFKDPCWTNIVSTLLLLGIRSLNALLAHSIAVNTSYRSSLGITNRGIQALIVLDLLIRRK